MARWKKLLYLLAVASVLTSVLLLPGRAFAGMVNVSARLQVSGTVGPMQSGDLVGHYAGNPVAVGATGVDMVLTPQR